MAFDARRVVRRLTGDLDIRAFDEEVRERRTLRVERAIDTADLNQLFDLDN